ncbi:hypothetical protein CBLAS_0984 [Campylobacter blaseri]|nr:NlpC/P60 family protein [Campylobacter blaseri]QKF86169.1 hypothetical protein CBLAS_0984 [Campylobacter blaseri]
MKNSILLSCLLCLVFMSGCAFIDKNRNLNPKNEIYDLNDSNSTNLISYNKDVLNLLNTIDKYKNKKTRVDCSGLVDLFNRLNNNIFYENQEMYRHVQKNRGKSQAIYNLYSSNNKITNKKPMAGDLIFFNNTTKATKNKKTKIITHIGIVQDVEDDGRVSFIHNIRGINKIGYVNLNKKNTFKDNLVVQNSYIIRCKSNKTSCLTSNRFAGFGVVVR